MPLQAGSQAQPLVRYNTDRKVPLQASSQAPLLVRRFRAFLSVLDLQAGPYSPRPIGHECKFCIALYFIQEAVLPNKERLMFKSCCKKGDAYLEPLKGVLPYL